MTSCCVVFYFGVRKKFFESRCGRAKQVVGLCGNGYIRVKATSKVGVPSSVGKLSFRFFHGIHGLVVVVARDCLWARALTTVNASHMEVVMVDDQPLHIKAIRVLRSLVDCSSLDSDLQRV